MEIFERRFQAEGNAHTKALQKNMLGLHDEEDQCVWTK